MKLKMAPFSADGYFLVPKAALRAVKSAGKNEITALLMISEALSCSPMEEDALTELLKSAMSGNAAISAAAFWRGAGILLPSDGNDAEEPTETPEIPEKAEIPEKTETPAPSIPDEAPFYSARELGEAAENNADFRNLVSFTEGRIGKVLNESELARLYSFLDYLKMPANVIMLSVEDCCSRGKSSLRYISKQLIDFEENGADTYEKAEALLMKRRNSQNYENFVRTLFGIGERKLVPKEKEAIRTWQDEWHFEREMLEAAYEKTVAAAKKPSINYMHKILEKWHESGFSAPADVGSGKKAENGAPKSFDTRSFFEAAVSKNRKN